MSRVSSQPSTLTEEEQSMGSMRERLEALERQTRRLAQRLHRWRGLIGVAPLT
jgi:hypothetical protein